VDARRRIQWHEIGPLMERGEGQMGNRMRQHLSFDVTLDATFDDCVSQVTATLKTEDFGVLTRVDIHTAFKEKLGKEFRPYAILGACNPPLAYAALTGRPEAGLMLPCNLTVEEVAPGKCLVRIVNPEAMMQCAGFGDDPALAEVGTEATAKLARVSKALAGWGEAPA